jgi:hypothetical protein
MHRKQGLAIIAAACAALAGGQWVRAADAVTPRAPLLLDDTAPSAGSTTGPATGPAAAATPTPTVTPLMGALDTVGLKAPLDNAGITITGFVEGGWTVDTSNPPGHILPDRAFDTKSNSIQLDQVELDVSRSVDYTKPFDFGVNVEQIYGTDAAYFHANGLALVSNGKAALPFGVPGGGGGSVATIHPKAQYDITQANFTISSNAVAKGIAFEGGKFTTLLGEEYIDPYSSSGTNAFYSHSFIFTQEPFTHTGALGILNLTDAWTFQGGITRGWDQATEDNNGSIDFIGQAKWVVNPKCTLYFNGITGHEEPDVPAGFAGANGVRTVFDIVGSYQLSDQLSLAANGMYAWESQTGNAGAGGGNGQWYGVAAYASYKVADQLTFNVRGEWFDDQDGAAPTLYNVTGVRESNQYYELTVGATIHPAPNNSVLANFFFRPEVRFDYANHAAFDAITDPNTGSTIASDHYFCSAGVDAVYAF